MALKCLSYFYFYISYMFKMMHESKDIFGISSP